MTAEAWALLFFYIAAILAVLLAIALSGNRDVARELRGERAARRIVEAALRQAESEAAQYRRYVDQARIAAAFRIRVDTTGYQQALEQIQRDITRFERGER